jgi:hypothetical protein
MLYIYPPWEVSIQLLNYQIYLVQGVYRGNATDAVTRYREKYRNWRLPNCCTVFLVMLTTDSERYKHAVTLIFFEYVGY